MKRLVALLALLSLPVGATCIVERHGWQTWVCDLDAEKPATNNKEGDHVWAKDTNKLYYWDGAAWMNIGAGGGGGAPTTATYLTQTPDATLSAEQAMSLLASGITVNATGTGVQSIYAGASCGGTDKATALSSTGSLTCSPVAYANVTGTPAIPADISGASYWTRVSEASLSAESALGSLGTGIVISTTGTGAPSIYAGTSCTNQFPRSLNASGAATCSSVGDADVTSITGGKVSSAVATATALAADPADCAANAYAQSIVASGALTCKQVAYGEVTGAPTIPVDLSAEPFVTTLASSNLSAERVLTAGSGIGLDASTTGIITMMQVPIKVLPRVAGLPKVRCNAVRRTNCS
jgi:hypothetical protein